MRCNRCSRPVTDQTAYVPSLATMRRSTGESPTRRELEALAVCEGCRSGSCNVPFLKVFNRLIAAIRHSVDRTRRNP
ncbi:MAG: hypothetical protein HY340_02045 [Candidatus Kerfeldbacteria bacterium]|nr:hypothetical protein [Candidatus Kerfeldbacteria bacterium]